jgi:hypothetical protein
MSDTLGPVDKEMTETRALVMGPYCDASTNQRGFAILCGAAAGAAARFHDEIDLGGDLSEEEQGEWGAICHLLMRLADRYTCPSPYVPGEVGSALLYLQRHLTEKPDQEAAGEDDEPCQSGPSAQDIADTLNDDPPEQETDA